MSWDAVVVDLDGTLLLPDGSVGERTVQIFEQVRKKGIPIFVATGRPLSGALQIVPHLPVEPIMAVYNGAQIVDWDQDRILKQSVLDSQTVDKICNQLEDHQHDHIIYHDEIKHMRTMRHVEICDQLADIFLNVRKYENTNLRPKGVCPRVSFFGFPQELEKTVKWLDPMVQKTGIYVESFSFEAIDCFPQLPMDYVEVHAACSGKLELLSYLENQWGLDRSRIVAFGDQNNDIEIIREAGLGIAVGNAFASCREVADEVIGTNAQEAVASRLEELFL